MLTSFASLFFFPSVEREAEEWGEIKMAAHVREITLQKLPSFSCTDWLCFIVNKRTED